MKFSLIIANQFYLLTQTLCSSNVTTKRTFDDEYYLDYDYEVNGSFSQTRNVKLDSLILPNPESFEPRLILEDLPNIELPDDSLADTDLRDHDFIDNLMYVYYGSHNKSESNYGSEIIIIGSVLSCAAQLLTIFCVLLRRRNLYVRKEISQMFLHLMGCLCVSNFLFMFGVNAIKNQTKCQVIALVLHYLNLLTSFWIFIYTYCICRRPNPKNYIFGWTYLLPAALTILFFVMEPNGYESKRFCFLSVQKGMILNYMSPVSALIILTTVYCLNGIRKINLKLSKLELSSAESLSMLKHELDVEKKQVCSSEEEIVSLKECKSCLKLLCVLQTTYDVVWFMVVLALENVNYSNCMPVFYSVSASLLNWYIFIKSRAFLPTISTIPELTEATKIHDNVGPISSPSRRGSSDNIPLLLNSDGCTEMKELRQETISTIST